MLTVRGTDSLFIDAGWLFFSHVLILKSLQPEPGLAAFDQKKKEKKEIRANCKKVPQN